MMHFFVSPVANHQSLKAVTALIKLGVMIGITSFVAACGNQQSDDHVQAAHDTPAPTLRIAAAANLSDVLPDVVAGYQLEHSDIDVELSFASSGKLYAQIEAGAPFDVFLSANQSYPAKLATNKAQKDNASSAPTDAPTSYAPFAYSQGQLAVYSVTQSLDDLSLNDVNALLAAPSGSKIAIANPKLAPYGEAAKAYLTEQRLYTPLHTKKRLVQAENINQAFQYAHTGSVDYGFVAQSQVRAVGAQKTQYVTLPSNHYPPILQDGLQLSDHPAATDFVDYLQSSAGQAHFVQAGYLSAPLQ